MKLKKLQSFSEIFLVNFLANRMRKFYVLCDYKKGQLFFYKAMDEFHFSKSFFYWKRDVFKIYKISIQIFPSFCFMKLCT